MRTLILSGLLVLAGLGHSADIEIPKEVKAKVGEFVQIRSTAVGEVEWYVLDSGIQFLPFDLLKDRKTAILFTLNPGVYRVLAWSAKDNNPTPAALCIVTIEGLQPTPPSLPAPPAPPAPPEPSALEKRLKPFFDHDPDPKRKDQIQTLASFFDELHKLSGSTDVKTIGELFQKGSELSDKMIGNEWLVLLRREINLYLDESLPRIAAQELDLKTRQLCIGIFDDLSVTLKKIGG